MTTKNRIFLDRKQCVTECQCRKLDQTKNTENTKHEEQQMNEVIPDGALFVDTSFGGILCGKELTDLIFEAVDAPYLLSTPLKGSHLSHMRDIQKYMA
jgi:hypothetical protein